MFHAAPRDRRSYLAHLAAEACPHTPERTRSLMSHVATRAEQLVQATRRLVRVSPGCRTTHDTSIRRLPLGQPAALFAVSGSFHRNAVTADRSRLNGQ